MPTLTDEELKRQLRKAGKSTDLSVYEQQANNTFDNEYKSQRQKKKRQRSSSLNSKLDGTGLSRDDYEDYAHDALDNKSTFEESVESRGDLSPDQKRKGLGNQRYNDTEYYTDTYRPQVEQELAKFEQQQRNQLDRLENQTDFAIDRNNDYLNQQLQQFEEKKNQNLEQVNTLQNRRGGFYSGGVDYQRGQVMDATTDAKQQLSSEVGSQNAQLNAQYAQMAQEATQKINQMRQQAPDKVRQLVEQAKQGDQQAAMAEAQITGMYNGQQTLQAQSQQFNQTMDQQMAGLKAQAQEFEQNVQLQQLALQNAKMQMSNEQWQAEFEQNAQQFGMEYALQKAVQENKMSMQQAQQAMQQSKFQWQQQQDQFNNQMDQNQFQLRQDQLQLREDQFQFDQEQSNRQYELEKEQLLNDMNQVTQESPEIQPIIDQLNNMYLEEDMATGQMKVSDQQGLERAILNSGLNDQQMQRLYGLYGIPLPQ